MKMTKKQLDKLFDDFNKKLFGGNLPKVKIVTYAQKRNYIGYATARFDDESFSYYDYKIEISVRYANWSYEDWCGVLLHEMIHIFDYYEAPYHFFCIEDGVVYYTDYDAHGYVFKHIAGQIKNLGYDVFVDTAPGDCKTLSERAIKLKNKKLHISCGS